MNKKGFTLIELLAVIVVLGIVAVIGAFTVLPQLEKSRKEAVVVEANNVKKSAQAAMALINIGSNEVDGHYLLNDSGTTKVYCFTLENLVDMGLWQKSENDLGSDSNKYEGRVKVTVSGNNYSYETYMTNHKYYVRGSGNLSLDQEDVFNEAVDGISLSCDDVNVYASGYFSGWNSASTDYLTAMNNKKIALRAESSGGSVNQHCGLINGHLVCVSNYANSNLQSQCSQAGGTYSLLTNSSSHLYTGDNATIASEQGCTSSGGTWQETSTCEIYSAYDGTWEEEEMNNFANECIANGGEYDSGGIACSIYNHTMTSQQCSSTGGTYTVNTFCNIPTQSCKYDDVICEVNSLGDAGCFRCYVWDSDCWSEGLYACVNGSCNVWR